MIFLGQVVQQVLLGGVTLTDSNNFALWVYFQAIPTIKIFFSIPLLIYLYFIGFLFLPYCLFILQTLTIHALQTDTLLRWPSHLVLKFFLEEHFIKRDI